MKLQILRQEREAKKMEPSNISVKMYDKEGREIKSPSCRQCGKVATMCLMGVEEHLWLCEDCAFGTKKLNTEA